MKAIIIADDLTGALDSSAAFAQRGLRTTCALTIAHFSEALETDVDVVALSTGSREITAQSAAARLSKVAEILRAHPSARNALRLKKIDSRLKGHIAIETRALHQDEAPILLCPAIPVLGRIVRGGCLQGAGVKAPLPIRETAGLPEAEVLEAEDQHSINRAIVAFDRSTLFVGAAGLATALAEWLAPSRRPDPLLPLPRPALYAIGSRDPVTLAQLESFTEIVAPNGRLIVDPPVRPTSDPEVIRMVPGAENVSGTTAKAEFARTVAARIRSTRPASLLACGGETGGAILRELGCGLVEVLGEALPGLPVSRAINGPVGMLLATKSGGFGAPDMLMRMATR